MTEEEKKAIEDLKDILKYWQTIVDIEDDVEREIEMTCYSEEMPFEQLKIALNLIEKQAKEIKERKNEEKTFFKWLSFACKELGIGEDTPIIDMLQEIKNNYVSKEYIKQKLKELKRDIKKCGSTDVITRHIMANEIEFLEKLVKGD